MPKLQLQLAKIVGSSTVKEWSQIHTFLPEEKEKLTSRGQLLAVISLTGLGKGVETTVAGREVIARLHEEYYGQLEGRPFVQLKKAASRIKTEVGEEAEVEIVAAALVGEILFLAISGNGQIFLRRQGEISLLLSGTKEKIVTASGPLQDGDLLLLGSKSFFRLVSQETIQAALATESVEEAAEILRPTVHGQEESGAAAALIIKSASWRTSRRKERKVIFRPAKRSKKTLSTVALILLFLLMVSLVLGIKQRRHLAREGQEKEAIQKEIQAPPVFREHQVEPRLFFDLELIKAEAKASDFAFSGGQLIILDQTKAAVYSLDLAKKKSAIIAGGEAIKTGSQIAVFGAKIFVLTEEGIVQTSLENKKQELVIKQEGEWGEVVDLRAFAGNLYLLDKDARPPDWRSQVWKYSAIEGGFGPRQAWLKSEGKSDFSQAVSMAINGAIWILKADGTIEKYIRGLRDNFGVIGLDKPFSSPTALYTDDDQEHLFILDQGNARVVVLKKSGEYEASYLSEKIKETTGLVAWEKEKKIFLLGRSKIYEIEMR